MSFGDPILRYRGMKKRYGDVAAVDGLDLAVRRGEMFGLIGPDGAGKTTCLRVGLGLLRADEGEVETCGLEPFGRRRKLARHVGYLSQRFSLYGDLSVDENAAFFAAIHGVKGWRRRRDELLDLVRLTPFRTRLAERLSGGMKQKLALACTLIHQPDFLVLDEPTTGVDPVSRRDFWRLLARLQQDGLTLFVTTPYLDEAERCQRVGLMHRGRLLLEGEPGAIRREFPARILEVVARPSRDAAERLREDGGVSRVEIFGERLHAVLAGSDAKADDPMEKARREADRLTGSLRCAGIEVDSCNPVLPSLEDVFIARIREADSASGPHTSTETTTDHDSRYSAAGSSREEVH
jgi:ABC-2 type transport system ATP-binding protein